MKLFIVRVLDKDGLPLLDEIEVESDTEEGACNKFKDSLTFETYAEYDLEQEEG